MKRVHFQALLDDAQRENSKLKDEVVELRKKLNAYQSVLAQQLTTLGHPPDHYDSLLDALNAFLSHHRVSSVALALQAQQLIQTTYSLQQSETRAANLANLNQELIATHKKLEEKNRDLQEQRKREARKLCSEIEEANKAVAKLNGRLSAFQRQADMRETEAEQRQRSAIASAISAARRQLVDYRMETERQFQQQTKKLRDELLVRDENLRQLSKMFQKCEMGREMQGKHLQSVRSIVKSLADADQLNQLVAEQREEIADLSREIKDVTNRKISTEARLNESKAEILNLISKIERKDKRIAQEEMKRAQVVKELEISRKDNAGLEHYFQEKWNNQFEKVKQHLQKVLAQKIRQNEAELQIKKAQVARKIESYLFIHNEDQKLLAQLRKKLADSQLETQQSVQRQKVLQCVVYQRQSQLRQTNSMLLEQEEAMLLEMDRRNEKLKIDLSQMEVRISLLAQDSLTQEKQLQKQAEQLNKIAQEEIHSIEITHLKEKQVLKQIYHEKIAKIDQEAAAQVAQLHKQIQYVKEDGKRQLLEVHNKMKIEANRRNREIEKEREKHKQQEEAGHARECALRAQIQEIRKVYSLKVQDLEVEIQIRKAAVKRNIDKSQNDEELKKELRELIDNKMAENRKILAEKQELKAQIEVDSSQLFELREEIKRLTFTRDDWLQAIQAVKLEMEQEIFCLQKIHARTVQALKSKIWQLQQRILRRPARIQDQRKIRNLSEQKQQLQQKVQLQQAENIILQQLRHHYEVKSVLPAANSQMNSSAADFKKPQAVAILSRKPRRLRHTQSQFSEEEDEGDTVKDMKRMRKYLLQRRQQSGDRNYLKSTVRSRG